MNLIQQLQENGLDLKLIQIYRSFGFHRCEDGHLISKITDLYYSICKVPKNEKGAIVFYFCIFYYYRRHVINQNPFAALLLTFVVTNHPFLESPLTRFVATKIITDLTYLSQTHFDIQNPATKILKNIEDYYSSLHISSLLMEDYTLITLKFCEICRLVYRLNTEGISVISRGVGDFGLNSLFEDAQPSIMARVISHRIPQCYFVSYKGDKLKFPKEKSNDQISLTDRSTDCYEKSYTIPNILILSSDDAMSEFSGSEINNLVKRQAMGSLIEDFCVRSLNFQEENRVASVMKDAIPPEFLPSILSRFPGLVQHNLAIGFHVLICLSNERLMDQVIQCLQRLPPSYNSFQVYSFVIDWPLPNYLELMSNFLSNSIRYYEASSSYEYIRALIAFSEKLFIKNPHIVMHFSIELSAILLQKINLPIASRFYSLLRKAME